MSISAVERLQRLQIYPIVLLLRFKSAKQIRDIRDFGTDKISAKAAKEMYERALKLEFDYKQYISGMLQSMNTLCGYILYKIPSHSSFSRHTWRQHQAHVHTDQGCRRQGAGQAALGARYEWIAQVSLVY